MHRSFEAFDGVGRLRIATRRLSGMSMTKTALDLPITSQKNEGLFASRPAVYIFVVIATFLVAYAYYLRTFTILSCQADGYSGDRYIAYCNGGGYGDYEHGAFWFDLEPAALNFASKADVLFLGNSRVQIAFSTVATADWFSAASRRYYLMGFSYHENMLFAEEILRRIRPRAAVYVINVDNFFQQYETPPMKTILHDPEARHRYEAKRFWQDVHESICNAFAALCGDDYVIFRSRETGEYTKKTDKVRITPVSYDEVISQDVVESDTAAAINFLSQLDVGHECVILTMVPTVETKIGNARAVAKALGIDLIISENLGGLQTFDGSHLDKPSAERWSRAFLQTASSKIQSCLEKRRAAQ